MHSDKAQNHTIVLIALLLGVVGISFAPIFVRLSEVGPISTAFWRVTLAIPFFWFCLPSRNREKIKNSQENHVSIGWLITPGIFFGAGLSLWHLAIQYTSVANSTLLANFAVILVSLFAWHYWKERFGPSFVIGAAFALFGIALLVGIDYGNFDQRTGNFIALIAAVGYAAYLISIKKVRKNISTQKIMYWSTISCSMTLLPIMLLSNETVMPQTANGWWILFGLAFAAHFAGQGLITYAIAHLPASFSAVNLLLQPVIAAILAWVLLSEALSGLQIAGGMIVLIGLYLAKFGHKVLLKDLMLKKI